MSTASSRENASCTPKWMLTGSSDGAEPSPSLNRSFSTSDSTFSSSCSYKSKYEPLHSVHADIQDAFLRSKRNLYSRGHEIPEPSFSRPSSRSYSPGKSPHGSSISRGSSRFSIDSRDMHNRPHTSGTKLPPCYSPIRPTERGKQLFSRATSPVVLRHGNVISKDIFGKKFRYPLNNISYEPPSIVCHSLKDAAMPDGADSILEDSRFASIAPFSKKEFYDSMPSATMKELAEKRKRKRIVTKSFSDIPPLMTIDYEKRGSPGATKRQVHKQIFC